MNTVNTEHPRNQEVRLTPPKPSHCIQRVLPIPQHVWHGRMLDVPGIGISFFSLLKDLLGCTSMFQGPGIGPPEGPSTLWAM